jgi:hypothetical protein
MNGLLIKREFIENILSGQKCWEIRGSRTAIRGRIALIQSGSGKITGACDLADCLGPLTQKQFQQGARKAGLRRSEAILGYYGKTFAWVLANPRRLRAPVRYKHPSGAVIWVKLSVAVERAVNIQLK